MRWLILCTLATLTAIGCNRQAVPPPPTIAQRVTVVDRTDLSGSVTNVVDDPTAIAALEALFPAYETRPKSDIAAGYIAQYVFTFDLRDHSSVRVGSDGDGELWSTGNGDLRVVGDLKKTLRKVK